MHKQSDKLATIQRLKCHSYDRDGADCTFSQDLKISTCQRIYIYVIFDGGSNCKYPGERWVPKLVFYKYKVELCFFVRPIKTQKETP